LVLGRSRYGSKAGQWQKVGARYIVPLHPISITAAGPGDQAVGGHLGEFADAFQVGFLTRRVCAQISPRPDASPTLLALRQFGVFVGLLEHSAPEFPLRRKDRFRRPDRFRRSSVACLGHGKPLLFEPPRGVGARYIVPLQALATRPLSQTRILAVRPAPPVEELNLMRRNFALTPVTVRASPAVLVLESMFWYSASTSAMAPWSERFTAVGAVPTIVCHRTTRPESGKPAGKLSANCVPDCALPGNASLL